MTAHVEIDRAHSAGRSARGQVLRRLHAILAEHPGLGPRYETVKEVTRAFRHPAFYEVSARCNLYCEGCYYFEKTGRDDEPADPGHSLADWDAFFAREAARGVSMAYFVGAEPALHQDRLLAAASYFPHGNIGTNGTIPIDRDVPYRIGVSVWAAQEATDRQLRGASVFRKALKNYEGDPRAIMLFTVTAWNIDEIPVIAKLCRDHGVELTFNFYSPTRAFNAKLAAGAPHDSSFFRESTAERSPVLSVADLPRVRGMLGQLISDYPETIAYSPNFNAFVTAPGSLYSLDSDGVAIECGSRVGSRMRYYRTDLVPADVKCATPDVDCATCRMYSGAWSSRFEPGARDVASLEAVEAWLETIASLGRIFLMKRDR